MSTASPRYTLRGNPDYPYRDGKPMSESGIHMAVTMDLIATLRDRYADEPMAYVGGDLMMFYEPGNKKRHVSPDVFVSLGVPQEPERLNYIVWEEGKVPDFIIEVTSKTRRKEDQQVKLVLYRDVLKIPEYVLFDPTQEYLKPSFQAYRLVGDAYEPFEVVNGRLRSAILGLDLAREGQSLRFFDAATGAKVLTPREQAAQARDELERARDELERARGAAQQVETENERLRREVEELRRRLGGS